MPTLPSTSTSDLPESSKSPKNGPPSWFAATLVATTVTAAVVIPGAIYLRRKKNLKFPVASAPPRRVARNGPLSSIGAIEARPSSTLAPPRRQTNNIGLDALPAMHEARPIHPPTTPSTNATPAPSRISTPNSENPKPFSEAESETVTDDFNPAFYTIKAFGLSTILVTIGAVATVWGVKTAMGVENTQQFARRMRYLVLTHMPILSSRIHRSVDSESDSSESGSRSQSLSESEIDLEGWNWQDAEERLKVAFEKDGLLAWAEAALKELEVEEKLERRKRRELEEGRGANAAGWK